MWQEHLNAPVLIQPHPQTSLPLLQNPCSSQSRLCSSCFIHTVDQFPLVVAKLVILPLQLSFLPAQALEPCVCGQPLVTAIPDWWLQRDRSWGWIPDREAGEERGAVWLCPPPQGLGLQPPHPSCAL